MVRGRGGGRGGFRGQQNYSGGSNNYFERNQNRDNNSHGRDDGLNTSSSGIRNPRGRKNSTGESIRGSRSGYRGARGGHRGESRGYNRHHDFERNQNHENGHFNRNRFSQEANHEDDDDQEKGFRKFRDPNASPSRGSNFGQHSKFGSYNTNNSAAWSKGKQGNYLDEEISSAGQSNTQIETIKNQPEINPQKQDLLGVEAAKQSPIRLKEKEPKLLRKIKTEKITPDPPVSLKSARSDAPSSSSSSSSDSSEEEESQAPPKTKQIKTSEKSKPDPKIKIKKEHVPATEKNEKKKTTKEPPIVPPPPAEESSSSESSSSESSSSEEEIPNMPQPMRSTEALKPKKERASEDDVVCLGKPNNIENLIDDEEKVQSKSCMICKNQGHSSLECQMKCKKCSHSSYECQMVCKNCGETYNQSLKSCPKPPNPFVMFMQFMQFCMSQYCDFGTDTMNPFPQIDNASSQVQKTIPNVEVTHKDIANAKRKHKKSKAETKQSRKRLRPSMNSDMNTESDSDSSSKATTSTKKRKKRTKVPAASELDTTPTAHQQQQHQLPSFGGPFPTNVPFVGAFNAPGYNPMMAFSQMMGFNPAAMNFPR